MNPAAKSLQENILVMLCYNDEHIKTLISNVKIEMFDNEFYRDIADKAIKYYKEFGRTPADHLADLFEKQLASKNKVQAKTYEQVLVSINTLKDDIHPKFVMRELNKFVREQNMRLALHQAVTFFQEGKLDDVDRLLDNRKTVIDTFDQGLMFGSDMERTLSFLYNEDEIFWTGIPQLDELGVAPARGELFTFVGLPSTGKSWGLVHLGKMNLLTRSTVLHISLEMSEPKCSMRYVQSLLSIAKSSRDMRQIELTTNKYGVADDMELVKVLNYSSLKDDDIGAKISAKLGKFKFKKPRLIIKQFPTGMLTIDMLKAYLENLATYCNIHPDILIVDYADLMALDSKFLRVETGQIYQKLRGLAIEHDMAVVTASQANRVGENVVTLTRKHLAEDFSKVAISDNVVTYNQTAYEYKLGLARLYVDKARNDRKGDTVLVTQNYNMGQYCLQSSLIRGNYFDVLEERFKSTVASAEVFNPRQRLKITKKSTVTQEANNDISKHSKSISQPEIT